MVRRKSWPLAQQLTIVKRSMRYIKQLKFRCDGLNDKLVTRHQTLSEYIKDEMRQRDIFEGMLTAYQQQRVTEFYRQTRRVAKILNGSRKMGMNVPEIEVLGNDFWADKNLKYPQVTAYSLLMPDESVDLVVVRKTGIGGCMQYFSFSEGINYDTFKREMHDHGKIKDCKLLMGLDAALDLRAEDVAKLDQAAALLDAWTEYLCDYVQSILDVTSIDLFSIGVSTENSTIYMTDTCSRHRIIRWNGKVVWLENALEAADHSEHFDDWQDEVTIGRRIAQLRAAT